MIMMKCMFSSLPFLRCDLVDTKQCLSIRDLEWTQCNKKNAPITMPEKEKRQKLYQSIAVKKGAKEKQKGCPKETGYLSCQVEVKAISSLLSMMIGVIVVQRQRSTASLPTNLVPHHRQRILISSHLTRTLRRLINRRRLPIPIRRRRGLKLRSTMRHRPHILHRNPLLRRIRRILLLIIRVVVLLGLLEGGSSVAATRNEPAVVGEWGEALANAALSVEVGAEEDDGDGDED
jgi:hypothetical protein